MAIYEITEHKIQQVQETSFGAEGIQERTDLQRLVRDQIEIVSPETIVVSEEFGDWEESKRRIDLLGLDKEANLVVIELKRTEHGGLMDLQAIRYAALVSTMTFDKVVEAHSQYCAKRNFDKDARSEILNFLEWESPDHENFAQETRIVLVSAEFSKELTTAVMWLNDQGLDIRCIRLKPYKLNDKLLIDAQQIIPLPEASEYLVQLREKEQTEKASRKQKWDEKSFLQELRKSTDEEIVAIAKGLIDWVEPLVSYIWWGEGKLVASFVAILRIRKKGYHFFTVWSDGRVGIWLWRLRGKGPFEDEIVFNEFISRLAEIPGLEGVTDSAKGELWFPLEVFKEPLALEKFKSTIEWAIDKIHDFAGSIDQHQLT